MALPKLIKTTDFCGFIALEISNENLEHVNNLLAEFEADILRKLRGDWLYNEIVSAMILNEAEDEYTLSDVNYPELYKLVYGSNFTNLSGLFEVYEGIIKYLQYQCYYLYKMQNNAHDSSIGTAVFVPEGSRIVTEAENIREAAKRFNFSIQWHDAAQRYIDKNYSVLFTGEGATQYGLVPRPVIYPINVIKTQSIL